MKGRLKSWCRKKANGALLVVRDYGVGIPEEAQRKRIFEGFFSTRDTMAYSSKRPFDFNAGGKGADLLRMKIFSERLPFPDRHGIETMRAHCQGDGCLPRKDQPVPLLLKRIEDCHKTGGTIFSLYFPPAGRVD
jgi:hypothetical protein